MASGVRRIDARMYTNRLGLHGTVTGIPMGKAAGCLILTNQVAYRIVLAISVPRPSAKKVPMATFKRFVDWVIEYNYCFETVHQLI